MGDNTTNPIPVIDYSSAGNVCVDQDGIRFVDSPREMSREARLYVSCDHYRHKENDSLASAVKAANNAKSCNLLRRVELTCCPIWYAPHKLPDILASTAVLGRLFLDAISKNANVEAVILQIPPPVLEFRAFLSTIASVKELEWNQNNRFPAISDSEENIVAQGFGSNRSIECLRLGKHLRTSLVNKIVVQLQTRPFGLTELSLHEGTIGDGDRETLSFAQDLRSLLQLTPGLQTLELDWYVIQGDEMEHVVEGLMHRRDPANPSVFLSKLSFLHCCLDDESLEVLVRFLQTRTTGDERSAVRSQLRELRFYNCVDTDGDDDSIAEGIVAMLAVQQGKSEPPGLTTTNKNPCYYNTVGSQVSTLSVWLYREGRTALLDRMTSETDRIRPAHLDIHSSCYRPCEGLLKYLASTITLRELSVSIRCSVQWLVQGLRNNQSLYRVSVEKSTSHSSDKSTFELIHAYCQRNRALPDLLRSPQRQGPASTTGSRSRDEGLEDAKQATISLDYPTLLQTAQTNQRFALGNLSGSLVQIGDRLGPQRADGKRRKLERDSHDE